MDKLRKNFSKSSTLGRSTPARMNADPSAPSSAFTGSGSFPSASSSHHPYSVHQSDTLPIISGDTHPEDDEACPVCLESLSFSFKLPGEKPHIVPECGHALHEACFTAVYGPAVRGGMRKTSLGLCGVCRRPMKLGDGDNSKGNKLASLTGMASATNQVYSGREKGGTYRPSNGRLNSNTPTPYDPFEDDPVDHSGSVTSGSSDPSPYVVTPAIQVRPEFSSMTRSNTQTTQPLTCIVVVELASRRVPGASPMTDAYSPSIGSSYQVSSRPEAIPEESENQHTHSSSSSKYSHGDGSDSADSSSSAPFMYNTTPSALETPFASVVADLRNRMFDWKGHALSGLGPLKMYDVLSVRRDALVREFYVYLFKEAIICVLEEKKKTLGRLLHSSSSTNAPFGEGSGGAQNKGVLRLKGRIYVRHIKRVLDTSASGELSLTIDMEDERLESFILIFKDRSSLEAWRACISELVALFQDAMRWNRPNTPSGIQGNDMEEFGGRAKTARILSVASGDTNSTHVTSHDSLLGSSQRSTVSSATTSSAANFSRSIHGKYLSSNHDQHGVIAYHQAPLPVVTPHFSGGTSNSLHPVVHTPLDLICVISVPPPTASASTAALKIRLIKTTLDFVIASMGSKDRLSIVSYEVGLQGRVRKTPFLCLGRSQSQKRLTMFVDTLSDRNDGDEFLVPSGKDEKTDVVTAVNHGLDVVLQRKNKNPLSGMILVSDAADSARRAQMDLVLARAEAANVPIHSFGYGKSHDPASLWLMSNHTSGTYTFVKDWYDLRDCLAGCLGGMMSIALTNVKLHLRIVDNVLFRMRKVSGAPQAIVASDGRDVHVEIGELRYGEKKEMLVELELDNTSDRYASGENRGNSGSLNATDRFVQGLGSLNLDGSTPNLVDGVMDRLIDEVPVFELDGSFYDPAVAKAASRLANPVLLTVTLMPSTASVRAQPTGISDVVIVRRRMELLASDMITRALVLISRKNFSQAQKILEETKRILQTVLQNVSHSLSPVASQGAVRSRKELLSLSAVRTLQSVLQDLQSLVDALEENMDLFQHDYRNFGAQQAMILRDQKSWTGRTPTEKLFWVADNSLELVSRSHDWVANVSRECD